jgi:hypothetical protein
MEVNMNSISIGLGLSNVGSYSYTHLMVETTHIEFLRLATLKPQLFTIYQLQEFLPHAII